MKGKAAIAYQTCVVNDFYTGWTVLRVNEDDFDWCNKITTDGLSNVFEFDSMAYYKFLSKKNVKNLHRNAYR